MSNKSITEDKFLVLEIINIFQPIEKRKLMKILRDKNKAGEISSAFKKLIKDKRIVGESDKYRLTKYGLSTMLPGEARTIRDKYRMHYLYEIWKNRGGAL